MWHSQYCNLSRHKQHLFLTLHSAQQALYHTTPLQVYLWQCLILIGGYIAYVITTITLSHSRHEEVVHLDPRLHEVCGSVYFFLRPKLGLS